MEPPQPPVPDYIPVFDVLDLCRAARKNYPPQLPIFAETLYSELCGTGGGKYPLLQCPVSNTYEDECRPRTNGSTSAYCLVGWLAYLSVSAFSSFKDQAESQVQLSGELRVGRCPDSCDAGAPLYCRRCRCLGGNCPDLQSAYLQHLLSLCRVVR